jgi:hypothetical protein
MMLATALLTLLAANPGCAEEPELVRILVLDLESAPQTAEVAPVVGQAVAAEIAKVPGLEVLTADEIRAVVQQEAEKAVMGCETSSSCLAELAEALDAGLLVSGRVVEVEGVPRVALSLLNTRAIVTVGRVDLRWRGDRADLPEIGRAAAQLLVFEPEMRPPGSLEVEGAPAGAAVFVDDKLASSRAEGLEVGPHEVTVRAPGFVERTVPVLIRAGQTSRVDGALERAEDAGEWVVPVAVLGGIALAGAATAAAVYLTPPSVKVQTGITPPSLGATP